MSEALADEVGKAVSGHLYPGAVVWDVLGSGSFGAVYRVWQHPAGGHEGRWLAVKVPYSAEILSRLHGVAAGEFEDHVAAVVRRLAREASTLEGIRHPALAFVVGHGVDDLLHLSTELVEGETLARRLERGEREDLSFVFAVLRSVGGALAELHSRGLAHRDVSPRHVLITPEGEAVLADFGIAQPEGDAAMGRFLDADRTLFSSPEALSGGSLTPMSDQYSLGMMLLRILGNPVLEEEGAPGDSRATLDFLSRTRPDCPLGVYTVIARMLKHEPDDRWPSVAEAMEALEGVMEGRPVPMAPPSARPVVAAPPKAPPPPQEIPPPPTPDPAPAAVPVSMVSDDAVTTPEPSPVARRDEAVWWRWAVPLAALLVLIPTAIVLWPSGEAGSDQDQVSSTGAVTPPAATPADSGSQDRETMAVAPAPDVPEQEAAQEPEPPPVEADPTPAQPVDEPPTQPGAAPPTDPVTEPVSTDEPPVQPAEDPTPVENPEPEEAEESEGAEEAAPDSVVVLTVTGSSTPMVEGDGRTFDVQTADRSGTPLDVPGQVVWTSTDDDVVSVGPAGRVMGEGPGTAYVVAELAGARDSVLLQVLARPASLEIVVSEDALEPGDAVTPRAVVRDRRGNVLDADPLWSTSDPDVLGVVGGQVRARTDGTATLTATVGDLVESVTLTVTSPPPDLPDTDQIGALLRPVLDVLASGDAEAVAELPLESQPLEPLARMRRWADQEEVSVELLEEISPPVAMADLSRAAADIRIGFQWNYFAGSRAHGTALARAIFVQEGDTWRLDVIRILEVEEGRSGPEGVSSP